MNTYTLVVLCLIVIVIIFKLRSLRILYLKNLALPLVSILFILGLILLSDTAITSAAKGIKLWIDIVFPSLFPFFVASEILNSTGFVRVAGVLLEPIMRPLFNVPGCGSFAFAMGVTSGYPVGAKITSGMLEEKLLTKTESERLLAFTNNSGPLFIIGAVATGMFKRPGLGLFLLICHIAACITVGILFRFYGKNKMSNDYKSSNYLISRLKREYRRFIGYSGSNIGSIFGDAVKNSVMTLLAIGGFIILFSVIINILLDIGVIQYLSDITAFFLLPVGINNDIITSVLSGLFEITTGTNMVSKIEGVSLLQQLTAVSFIIGWAGLSVHSQVLSIVSKSGISIKPYLFGKFLQGVIAALYTYLALKIAGSALLNAKPAFSHYYSQINLYWYDYVFTSLKYLIASIAFITLLGTFSFLYSRLKRFSKS